MRRMCLILFGMLACLIPLTGQTTYISYCSGDTADVRAATTGGVVLMGGASEVDNAMRWLLERAGGGDVLVLRVSGADGYQEYLYAELGVKVNSVQTLVMPDSAAARHPYVIRQIRNAEALWIAGGDQGKYVNFWKNGPVEDAIRYLIREKKVPIGGTSAGMAILGEAYFSALNGTVTSPEALANPYNEFMTIGYSDFLDNEYLTGVITDTHFDGRDRAGRCVAFMARLAQDQGLRVKAIACEEHTAVCVDTNGIARVFGGQPETPDYACFLQTSAAADFAPEHCRPGVPLHWQRDNAALKNFRAPGNPDGSVTFDLRDWKTSTGAGGEWQSWWVENGVLKILKN